MRYTSILNKYDFHEIKDYVYKNNDFVAYLGAVYKNNIHDAKWSVVLYKKQEADGKQFWSPDALEKYLKEYKLQKMRTNKLNRILTK